eukprot:35874-Eustigmatos_ZCMA.PRE.1
MTAMFNIEKTAYSRSGLLEGPSTSDAGETRAAQPSAILMVSAEIPHVRVRALVRARVCVRVDPSVYVLTLRLRDARWPPITLNK